MKANEQRFADQEQRIAAQEQRMTVLEQRIADQEWHMATNRPWAASRERYKASGSAASSSVETDSGSNYSEVPALEYCSTEEESTTDEESDKHSLFEDIYDQF